MISLSLPFTSVIFVCVELKETFFSNLSKKNWKQKLNTITNMFYFEKKKGRKIIIIY